MTKVNSRILLICLNCIFFSFFFILVSCSVISGQTEKTVVAVVNGKEITKDEVDNSIIGQIFPLQQQLALLRKIALENLITKTLLEDEARKERISVEELRKKLTLGNIEVSSNEVEKEFLENSTAFSQMDSNEAKEMIRLGVESRSRLKLYRDALKKLRESARIELTSQDTATLPINVNLDGPSIGLREAAVKIVIFSDYQCPYCKEAEKIEKQLLQEYKTAVRFIHKNFLLQTKSLITAKAAFCVDQQGQFSTFHEDLFSSAEISESLIFKLAESNNLNLTVFKTCLNSQAAYQAVMKDMQEARRLGIDSTPTFLVNGVMIRGLIDLDHFKQLIEIELKKVQ